jgi:hypothetical protein
VPLTYGVAWESATSVYVASSNDTSGMLWRFIAPDTSALTNLTLAPGYPILSANFSGLNVTALRGLTGRTEGSSFVLYATTGSVSGSNALVRFDTSAQTWSLLAAATAKSDLRGVAFVPAALATPTMTPGLFTPTPSLSVAPTPSATTTPSSSASTTFGSSGSATATVAASIAATPSRSPSQAPFAASPRPFTPGNLAVLRAGDGTTSSMTSARPVVAYVDEYTPAGVRVQSITMPPSSCTLGGSQQDTGLMTLSFDGRFLVVPCFSALVGSADSVATFPSRTIARIAADGTTDISTVFRPYLPGETSFRSVVSYDGSSFWVSGSGVRRVAFGSANTTAVAVSGAQATRSLHISPQGYIGASISSASVLGISLAGSALPGMPAGTNTTALVGAALWLAANPVLAGEPDAHQQAATDTAKTPGGDKADRSEYYEHRAKREKFQAETAELDYLKAIGRLVSVDELRQVRSERYRAIRDKLLNIPDRVAAILAAQSDPAVVHTELTKEIKRVLHELSDDARAELARGTAERVAA